MLDRAWPRHDGYIEESDRTAGSQLERLLPAWARGLIGRVTSPHDHAWRRAMPATDTPAEFATEALAAQGVTVVHDASELEQVPQRGRVIFVANHPYDTLDGLIAISILGALRDDLKVLANEQLCALRELAPLLLVHTNRRLFARYLAPAARRLAAVQP